jgi:hypothetical protein
MVQEKGIKETAIHFSLSISKISRESRSHEIYKTSEVVKELVDKGVISWSFVHNDLASLKKATPINEIEMIAKRKTK